MILVVRDTGELLVGCGDGEVAAVKQAEIKKPGPGQVRNI